MCSQLLLLYKATNLKGDDLHALVYENPTEFQWWKSFSHIPLHAYTSTYNILTCNLFHWQESEQKAIF